MDDQECFQLGVHLKVESVGATVSVVGSQDVLRSHVIAVVERVRGADLKPKPREARFVQLLIRAPLRENRPPETRFHLHPLGHSLQFSAATILK